MGGMSARILDGTRIGKEIREEVRKDVSLLRSSGVVPGLAAILVGENPASEIYVRTKTRASAELGIHSETLRLPAEVTTTALVEQVEILNRREDIHGILVQLPLPPAVDAGRVLSSVRPQKDVDGFHPWNVGLLTLGRPYRVPCTPAGIIEMLRREGIPLEGARAVVVGRSDIVGKPMALLLLHHHATVTICHSRTRNLTEVASQADILVAAMGRAASLRRDHIKPGAVVIDVGMNRLTSVDQVRDCFGDDPERMAELERKKYTLVGDVHPIEAREVAGALTPVPGGVGPLTIAMLLANTVLAAREAGQKSGS